MAGVHKTVLAEQHEMRICQTGLVNEKHAIFSFNGWVWRVFLFICIFVSLFHAAGMSSPYHAGWLSFSCTWTASKHQ